MHSKNKSGGRSSGTNTNDSLSLTLRAGVPLSELNLQLLDTDTKLVLAEKEQALLGIRASENWALSMVFIFLVASRRKCHMFFSQVCSNQHWFAPLEGTIDT